MSNYETVIGMECHAELLTESKMFCGCANEFGGAPNTRTCPVCLGLPGSLPVMNKLAVELVLRTALALNCQVSRDCLFARKNYFYPDIPKGYQISQYDDPIGHSGYLDITLEDGSSKRVHIRRVHLEEDTGKLIHAGGNESEVDYNRSGVPLMEIVTEFPPDLHSAEEARAYLEKLRTILVYLNVSDGKMEEGHLRAEPNLSIRPVGSDKFGVKTEIKNLNSFKSVFKGVQYEVERQSALLDEGGVVRQETLGWNDLRGETYHMRFKEEEQEYRYFPEPDLVPLHFHDADIEAARAALPELPDAKRERFVTQYGVRPYDAAVLTSSRSVADFYEAAATDGVDPKAIANYVTGELARLLNASGQDITQTKVTPAALRDLIVLRDSGKITNGVAKTVLEKMFETGQSAPEIVEAEGLAAVDDEGAIAAEVDKVLEANPDVVAKIKAGNDKSMAFLTGQVMRATKGKARPDVVNRLLADRIK
ncbi:aspartyl/glutamyl-tRNA(Asn/Gln) amidotransferase subunit B [Capsulimonas corticalis]|uniref:Aspartyl/glutamyl-tRNA(Asn/Gln) amidotransferase subunit B n=1 Tax=Capsulimonas corticalis TaxID=2219043 RepID=A0A402CTH7_9BACT|nr:Asp-tRNA(Asn)/Glu-tRNA(Gln) amidotransferase subunit GatB [Capsulimonas corticalis]BDI30707.1 aspartyl/glutamyl-tRNA(Asn/Gln) amidotransferase subunit B [Capsulimonas corticalis]